MAKGKKKGMLEDDQAMMPEEFGDDRVDLPPPKPVEETIKPSLPAKPPVPEAAPKVPARPDPNAVSLRIFLTASGKKLDQMAGFQNFALKHELAPRSMKAWHDAYKEFLDRPIY